MATVSCFATDLILTTPIKCRIKQGWHGSGEVGELYQVVRAGSRNWGVVIFPGLDSDPDMMKIESLETLTETWQAIKEPSPNE